MKKPLPPIEIRVNGPERLDSSDVEAFALRVRRAAEARERPLPEIDPRAYAPGASPLPYELDRSPGMLALAILSVFWFAAGFVAGVALSRIF